MENEKKLSPLPDSVLLQPILATRSSFYYLILALLGGTTFKVKGSITPFAEARGEIGGGKTFILTGGVRF